jgi:hypothetical protein
VPGFRRYAATVAVFATGLYLALVIAVFGVISLLAGIEVVADPRAGLLTGPIAAAAATLLVLAGLLAIALRIPEEQQRVGILRALAIGAGAYLAYAFFGALAVLFGRADPLAALFFLGTTLIGPFAVAAGLIAFLIAVFYMLVLASRVAERGRPKWPWEKHDDEP